MQAYFEKLYSLFTYEDLFLIFLAIIIGLVIGAEREYKNKTAGLRTLMLVSVGSCTFTILSLKIGTANPDRLAANIITGIGFLGAGAIFKDENKISGITTACTIWITAALGMCIGSGHIYLGMLSTIVVLGVLLILVPVEQWIDRSNKVAVYKITVHYNETILQDLEKRFYDHGLNPFLMLRIKEGDKLTMHWRISGRKNKQSELASVLFNDSSILKLETQ